MEHINILSVARMGHTIYVVYEDTTDPDGDVKILTYDEDTLAYQLSDSTITTAINAHPLREALETDAQEYDTFTSDQDLCA